MLTLYRIRLYDWFSFHSEMRKYTRKNVLKKAKYMVKSYVVYFIFGSNPETPESKPLYIGCTRSFYWRMVKHKSKITPQSIVYIKEFATKKDALRYEKQCIKAWKPQLNIKYNTWWQYDLIG